MYGLNIQPTNPNADGKYFNYWVKDNYPSVNSVQYEELKIVVWFSNEPDQAAKDAVTLKYNQLTLLDVLVTQEVLDEEYFKDLRIKYGNALYRRTASMSRKNRMNQDPVPPHEQFRIDHTEPLQHIVEHALRGDFKTCYELLNAFTPTIYITAQTIAAYRIAVAMFITSGAEPYTDPFGIRVHHTGTYPEYISETIDASGIINNYSS